MGLDYNIYTSLQLQILELLEHKAIFTAGYKAVLHIWGMWNKGAVRADLSKDEKANEKEDYFC